MTTRTYKYGKYTCKAYKKPCGHGWEVGFTFGGHQIFVGNFIHAKECNAWWTIMNSEVQRFGKKYAYAPVNMTFAYKFMSNCMYKSYYSYLDRCFTKYQRGFTQAVRKDERKYSHFKKTWGHHRDHFAFRKAV